MYTIHCTRKKQQQQKQQNKTDKTIQDHSNKSLSQVLLNSSVCFSAGFLQIKVQVRIFSCAFIWHTDGNERTIPEADLRACF